MAIESALPSPATVPPKPQSEPHEERPSKDAAGFERWLTSDYLPGDASATTPGQTMQAGIMSATQVAQVADQALVVDSIVFEWMATATYLMSYVDHRGRGHEAGAPNGDALNGNVMMSASAGPGLSAMSLQDVAYRPYFASGLHVAGAGLPAALTERPETDATHSSYVSSTTSSGALAEWMTRAMKQISDAEGRTTWWVRDYQLSAAQIPALLDALLHSGQSRPDRIMLNGALVWQHSSNAQGVSNGD